MPDLIDQPPRRSAIILNTCDARANGASPFWTAGIGVGVGVMLSQLDDIDRLSQGFCILPPHVGAPPGGAAPGGAPPRAVLGAYLHTIGALAQSWLQRSRPALILALRTLHAYGDSLAFDAAALVDGAEAQASARLLDGMVTRLGSVGAHLEGLNADLGHYLEHMALASGELETDTVLVTQRLQADQVHASMLSEQLGTLQRRLAQARARQHAHWPLGAEAEQLRRDVASDGAALERVRRQLARIHACHGDTLQEAAFLQQLLPTLSAYLAGLDRMDAGVDATLLGLSALQARLRELIAAVLAGGAPLAGPQLDSALPHWRHLAARLAVRLG